MQFFNEMSTELYTFWMIAIPSTIFFALQMIMTFIGLDSGEIEIETDTDLEMDSDSDGDSNGTPFQMFTLRNLIAFLTIFGWSGIMCLENEYSLGFSIFIASISGFAMVVVLSSLFFLMAKLQHDSSPDIVHAVGKIAKVYLKIPAQGTGKVIVNFGGSNRVVYAITNDGKDIPTGSTVKVIEDNGGTLVVESTSNV